MIAISEDSFIFTIDDMEKIFLIKNGKIVYYFKKNRYVSSIDMRAQMMTFPQPIDSYTPEPYFLYHKLSASTNSIYFPYLKLKIKYKNDKIELYSRREKEFIILEYIHEKNKPYSAMLMDCKLSTEEIDDNALLREHNAIFQKLFHTDRHHKHEYMFFSKDKQVFFIHLVGEKALTLRNRTYETKNYFINSDTNTNTFILFWNDKTNKDFSDILKIDTLKCCLSKRLSVELKLRILKNYYNRYSVAKAVTKVATKAKNI